MIYVRFKGLDANGNVVSKGRIVWDGETMTPEPDSRGLRYVIDNPIYTPDLQEITQADGARFLENIHRQYRSAYFMADEAVEDVDNKNKETT